MLVIKQLMVPIDFHSISFPTMEVNGDQQLFGFSKFKITYFVFYIRKKHIHVWNDMGVSKWWQKCSFFGWTIHLKNLTQSWYYKFKTIKGIVHFEIKIWYVSAYPKDIQDVGVFFSSVDPILMFLGQTVLVCQSYNGRYRSLSLWERKRTCTEKFKLNNSPS